MFKKILLLLSFILFLGLNAFTISTYADCSPEEPNAAQFLRNCSDDTRWVAANSAEGVAGAKERVKSMAEKAIAFGALLAVGALVWAGIQYTSSFGEDEKIKHAKSTGVYAVIGLVLLMASFGLVDIVINFIYTLEK